MRGDDTRRKGSKKCASVSMDGDWPQKARWTETSSNTRCLEEVPVSRAQIGEDKVAEADYIVRARD